MNRNIIALFNGCFLDIQRRVPVIIETMNEGSVLACRNRADHEAHGQKPGNHECLSSSTIKYRLKIILLFASWHTRKDKSRRSGIWFSAFIGCKHATRKNKFLPAFSYDVLRIHKRSQASMQITFATYPSK